MTALAASGTEAAAEPWRDPSRPVTERVADLLGRMTLAEKLAQLGSVWIGAADDGGDGFAPNRSAVSPGRPRYPRAKPTPATYNSPTTPDGTSRNPPSTTNTLIFAIGRPIGGTSGQHPDQ